MYIENKDLSLKLFSEQSAEYAKACGDLARLYTDMGIYTKDNVKVFVRASKLTEEEFKTITGENYTA